MKNYVVNYKKRGSVTGDVFETMTIADNREEAIKDARIDLGKEFVVISVKLDK